MFTTKKQVDQHVKTSLAKLRNENEKRLRGLVIAKMYYKIGEYASAQHYVSGYLSSNEANAPAHRLLGDCYCKLKQSEKALSSYQRSFQLDGKQTDLLIDACNLILAEDLTNLKANAKFWCEAAGNARVQHESVFNLKLRLLASDDNNQDTKQVEEMIVKEINNRPWEVSPRLQLVNFYISKRRYEDCFKYVSDLFSRAPAQFLNSLDWHAAVHKALQLYRPTTDVTLSKNWEFWLLSITALDRQLSLSLAQEHSLSSQQNAHLAECLELLFQLDQTLYSAAQLAFPVRPELAAQMITHFQAQFLLHVATYLFKRERISNSQQWWTTTNNALPLLFVAFRLGIAATEEPWLKQATESTRDLVRLWQRQGAFRCSQAGRVLLSCIRSGGNAAEVRDNEKGGVAPFESAEELTNAARKTCSVKTWTTTIYRNLFTNCDQMTKIGTSYLVSSNVVNEPTLELPTVLRIQMYERIAESLQSDSLAQLVFLYLHNEKISECDFNIFAGLELTASNIFNCNAATLNKLDIETFLVATVMQTRSRIKADLNIASDGPRPATLPFACMARGLCTEEQLRWWQAAYNSVNGIGTEETWNIREVLQDGIETVRCVGSPKMDLMIALQVGDVLRQKVDSNFSIDLTTKKAYEQRVENIFQCALHLLKNQSSAPVTDKRRLFQHHSKANALGTEACDALIDGAIVFLAEHYFKAHEYETCIEQLTNIQLPYATYYIAEAYKKMDESNRNNRTPPRSGSYQNKVKEFLGQTQKLLASAATRKTHPLRTVVSNELKKIQYSGQDLNLSVTSIDEEFGNVSFGMNKSQSLRGGGGSERDSNVADQVTNLTALVTQLSMQNTMLQTELSDIRKMLQQQQKDSQQAAAVQSTLGDPLYRLEEQQRIAAMALANHHSPHYDYLNGRYSVGGYPMGGYPSLPFAAAAAQFPAHLRAGTPMYGQDPSGLVVGQGGLPNRGIYDSLPNPLAVPPQVVPPPPQQQQVAPVYYANQSALASQLQQQQQQGPLATSSTLNQQSLDQAFTSANSILKTWNSTYNNEPVEKTAPANVVITSSDPVPMHNTATTTQKLLSVTIPPQHIKNFGQMAVTAGGGVGGIVTAGGVKEDNLAQYPGLAALSHHSSTLSHTATNISGDDTATEEDYYENSGDYEVVADQSFVPEPVTVILPPQLARNEVMCFSGHTKLYRFVEKAWKERGVGDLKITKNTVEKKVRVTMHRDQTGVLCANHELTAESKLTPQDAQGTSLTWAANDFSEGELRAEKFCAKFKSVEAANGFKEAFEKVVSELGGAGQSAPVPVVTVPPPVAKPTAPVAPPTTDKFSFTFGGTPTATATSEAPKPSPFSGFSFGGAAAAATTTASPEKPFSSLFANIPKPTVENSLFGLKPATQSESVFAPEKPAGESSALNKSNAEDTEDDYVPTAQFKPVIPLPSLVEVKTGEEDEEVLFEHRAKLLRFDTSTKEWKERGLGNIRVLVQKSDASQVRLLMRREQVLKLACNQRISKDQEFKKMPNSDNALSWYAQDFAENELKTELFAIRFKTSDTCQTFLQTIQEAQKKMGAAKAVAEPAAKKKDEEPKKGFGDMFKPKVGSWECNGCLVVNKADVVYCVACDAPKDATVPKKEASSQPKGLDLSGVKPGQFSFGFGVKPAAAVNPPAAVVVPPAVSVPSAAAVPTPAAPVATEAPIKGFGDAFKPKAGSWECQTCYIMNKGEVTSCVSCNTSKDGTVAKDLPSSGFSFGAAAAAGGGFSFGMPKSSFSFGTPAPVTVATVTTTTAPAPSPFSNLFGTAAAAATEPVVPPTTNGPSFGDPSKATFNFVFKPKSPGKTKSPHKLANGAEEEAESDEENIEEENTAYFTPVIPLPDKVEAKTGEEDEDVLYSHRAKLYRFTDGEWKERGLGNVKILKHKQTGKLRVVMRREQVLKICLNHVLDEDVEYVVKDNKSWRFLVNDFSEGVVEPSNFCLRFKSPEIAAEFLSAVDSALNRESSGGEANVSSSNDVSTTTSGATEEEQKLIRDLRLPADFFNFKQAEECSGCRGCNDDSFHFNWTTTSEFVEKLAGELPLVMPDIPKTIVATPPKTNIFSGFNASQTAAATETTNLFGGTGGGGGGGMTMFSGSPTKPMTGSTFNTFSFNASFGGATTPASTETKLETATPPSTNIFGGLNNSFGATNTSSGSLFGSSTFGSTNTSAPTLFGGNSQPADKPTDLSKSPATIFGQASSIGGFGSKAPVFGSFNFGTASQGLTFGKAASPLETKPDETKAEEKPEEPEAGKDIFKMESGFSFASLAQQATDTDSKPAAPPAGGFFGLANSNDFRHFDKPRNGNGEADGEEDPNYDPHYEPIIALPEEITVSTGEEEEQKLFGERGCLYRYDSTNKEWKERGVGEFKILHHPEKGTYRFVMRREQIFKLVLNQAVTEDFECKPMNKSGKAYCWGAMNHAEQPGQLEQLAVRFKNTDIATRFEEMVQSCVANLRK